MSHVPEQPELYVCGECHNVYAGTPFRTDDGHRFEPPSNCAACGASSFVMMEQWVYEALGDESGA